jgi:hypothetical protein
MPGPLRKIRKRMQFSPRAEHPWMHARSLGGLRPHQRPIQKLAAFSGFVPTNAQVSTNRTVPESSASRTLPVRQNVTDRLPRQTLAIPSGGDDVMADPQLPSVEGEIQCADSGAGSREQGSGNIPGRRACPYSGAGSRPGKV